MSTRIALNGFGRVGRSILRAAYERPAVEAERATSVEEVNPAMREAAEHGPLTGIVRYVPLAV
jgi:glyceraldehyde-3-phosphate dehydrogenase/erythrose-4-phosphate dehydrogenase